MLAAAASYEPYHSTTEYMPLSEAIKTPDLKARMIKEYGDGWEIKFINVDGAQAAIMKRGDQAIVSFRGTHSVGDFSQCDDRIAGADFTTADGITCKVHEGFLAEMSKLQGAVNKEIADSNIQHIYMASHSMGAAVQELYRASLPPEIEAKVQASYGFGEPCVGGRDYVNAISGKYPDSHIVNMEGDPVPYLLLDTPGVTLAFPGGYVPSPNQTWINKEGQVIASPIRQQPQQDGNLFIIIAEVLRNIEETGRELGRLFETAKVHMPHCYIGFTEKGMEAHAHVMAAHAQVDAHMPDFAAVARMIHQEIHVSGEPSLPHTVTGKQQAAEPTRSDYDIQRQADIVAAARWQATHQPGTAAAHGRGHGGHGA